MKAIEGYKTYIVAAASVAIGVAELLGYDVAPGVDRSNALQFIITAITATTLRDAIAKK